MIIVSKCYSKVDKKIYYLPKIKGNKSSVFIIIFMFIMIIPTTAIVLTTTTNPVYGQTDQTSFKNVTDSSNIQSIPLKKVHVGDIDIAYKMLGKGDPILLFNGASDSMDAWDSSFLRAYPKGSL
jgi:hypothetical protein